jgi:cell division protein FtsQ
VRSRPALAGRVKDYVRVGDRRWDLELKNGVTVKLPEDGADRAMNEVVALDSRNGLLSRDITTVDMRLKDRVVVRLTPDALDRREAEMKALLRKRRRT